MKAEKAGIVQLGRINGLKHPSSTYGEPTGKMGRASLSGSVVIG